MPRLEDRIRKLCSEVLAHKGDEEFGPIIVELREALHQHIESLRERFGGYPILVERRARKDIPPLNKPGPDDQAKETIPTDVRT
jgi:hypothetical protein